MRSRSLGMSLVTLLIACCLTSAATTGEPVVGWILIGGENREASRSGVEPLGLSLRGDPANPKSITPALNPDTEASGEIFEGPFEDCPHRFHYHGTLYGVADNNLDCGWGVALPISKAPDEVNSLAFAIDSEAIALRLAFETIPPDYAGARRNLGDAEPFLQNVEQSLTNPPYSRIHQLRIKNLVRQARLLDASVGPALDRLAAGNPRNKDRKKAKKQLTAALAKKRKALEVMIDVKDLREEPGD